MPGQRLSEGPGEPGAEEIAGNGGQLEEKLMGAEVGVQE